VITETVSKEVAATVRGLLEHHRAQEMALLQAALQTAQQAAQTAQQAAQQAAAQTAEHKAQIHQLREELTAVKAKMAAMKQADAPGPGEPHPPPKWQPDTVTRTREQKLLASLAEQFRGGVADGKAIQSQLVGQLGHYTDKLDQITAKFSFLEQHRRLRTGGPSRSLSTSRVSQQGKSPAFSAGDVVVDFLAQPPEWPPLGVSADWMSPTALVQAYWLFFGKHLYRLSYP
jgi:DNA-binding protein H-NS